jgi:hypothetical protein
VPFVAVPVVAVPFVAVLSVAVAVVAVPFVAVLSVAAPVVAVAVPSVTVPGPSWPCPPLPVPYPLCGPATGTCSRGDSFTNRPAPWRICNCGSTRRAVHPVAVPSMVVPFVAVPTVTGWLLECMYPFVLFCR